MNSIPPLTLKLLWAAAASLLLALLPDALLMHLLLWPLNVFGADGSAGGVLGNFMPWQLVTHLFVNLGGKLIFIALTLYFFGGLMLETWWGARRYGLFLLACAIGATLLQFLASTLAYGAGLGGYQATAGADGVMYGILFACAYIAPNQQVMLILPPIPMKLKTLVIVMCALSLAFGLWNEGLVSQFGFLGGLLAAWLHIRYWRGEPPFGKRRKDSKPEKKKNHLRIVH
ncbi:rhomboid family intramembrane serine protease [Arenimonas oryziterrae]|uniref:Peptidase S54 rhomboid domain-containing protein n=1 Tax=Arenimonas oryziterrae DSM 21050 = YC6267 TaxID=1121015 RepID=A0A091AZQ2_9GAMM|nr:rhomboid family intramembrane serine protease [Arenimonas oryziterrae]KFN44906.1 hypothetical protein N789_02485 [Arenimonas oryziterrae DSM 21050 = YC6267]